LVLGLWKLNEEIEGQRPKTQDQYRKDDEPCSR
jgi:hypothetical protein